jgi:arylsulfatase
MDGFDQSDFLLGKQEKSNRDHLLTFVGDRLVAARWKQFRIYPLEMGTSATNPEMAGYLGTTRETAGFPRVYNIEADPKEQVDLAVSGYAWVLGMYGKLVKEYKMTLKDHPNPPAPNLTKF